jgi:hypothetical protein
VGANVEINNVNQERANIITKLNRDLRAHLNDAQYAEYAVMENGDNFDLQSERIQTLYKQTENKFRNIPRAEDHIKFVGAVSDLFEQAWRDLQDCDRKLNDSRERMEVAAEILFPEPLLVNLDNARSPLEIINTLPAPIVAQMGPEEQRGLIDMIHEEDPQVAQDLISSLMESFSEQWTQDPAYQKLGNIMDNIIANEPPESPLDRTMTYNEDDEPRMPPGRGVDVDESPVRRYIPPLDMDPNDTIPADEHSIRPPDPPDNDYSPLFPLKRGGKLRIHMNYLWEMMRQMKFVRKDFIKDDDGYWHAMNGQELVRRLVAMTHGKMKKPDPDGFGIALHHFSRNIPILAYMGDYARRAFIARYNTQIPRRQELVNGKWEDVQPKGRRNIRAIREHSDDDDEVINISDT